MKYIFVSADDFLVGHFLVSDQDAAKLLEMTPSDEDFDVEYWTFEEYGFRSWTTSITPRAITKVKAKPFPA